ncbi:MAG: response regulator transcription factor [Aquabacterium sp.]
MAARILIADDEPNILMSLEFLLRDAGYEVATATDGQQALDQALQDMPDLVLLDVMMPRVSGWEVCQRLRALPQAATLRIIMLSAKGREVEVNKGLAMGADAYITKPFAIADVLRQVQQQLAAGSAAG